MRKSWIWIAAAVAACGGAAHRNEEASDAGVAGSSNDAGPSGDAGIATNPADGGTDGGTPSPSHTGFYVQGRNLFDPAGERVLLRGVNKMNIFTDRDGSSFPEIRKTGANAVRIVWMTADGDFVPTPADLDTIIRRAREAQMVPMIELHDATGDWSKLGALVDYWTRADIAAVLAKHEKYLLLNIGNEVGDDQVTLSQFTQGYQSAVARIRNAGLHMPLVIDAPEYGKNIDVLTAAAPGLLSADADHNLVFSAHAYWSKGLGADFIRGKLQAAADADYALIVGEFSKYGAYPGPQGSMCSEAGEALYLTILEETAARGIGWFAWEWGPGNAGGGDPLCVVMDMTAESTFATLKEGWAAEVALTSPYGIRNTSVTPSSMR